MAGFCKCGDGLSNLGVLSCQRVLSSVKKHIRVSTFNKSGERNSIKFSEMVDGKISETYILGKLQEEDALDRWFLTPKTYENVEPSRTDSSFEDFSSGAKIKVDTGVKEFMGIIPQVDSQIAAKMNAGACGSFGVYEIDTAGSIKGEMSADGSELFPITVAAGSFEAVEIEAVEGTSVQRVQVSFQYAKTVNEGQLRIIASDSIEASLLQINGALNGTLIKVGDATTASITAKFLIADFGYYGEEIAIEGQTEITDWDLRDSSLNPVVITMADEISDGLYEFVFATPATSADVITVEFAGKTLKVTDQSYESDVLTVTI